jgi:hypothetical protein
VPTALRATPQAQHYDQLEMRDAGVVPKGRPQLTPPGQQQMTSLPPPPPLQQPPPQSKA